MNMVQCPICEVRGVGDGQVCQDCMKALREKPEMAREWAKKLGKDFLILSRQYAENPCDGCDWMNLVNDNGFPCSHCEENLTNVGNSPKILEGE